MKRVRCLYRVSSKQQLHGDDIPLQRNECKEFIAHQSDWQFDSEYIEKGVSGYRKAISERDILMEIVRDASKKEFDILLVYMSDRLGRREGETPLYVSNLNNLGIEVWSVKEGKIETEEHIDKLLNYIRFWQAEGESRKTGIRVRDAQLDKVKKGEFVGGCAPLGYDLVPTGEINAHGRIARKLVINEEKAKLVRQIYNYALNYGYGSFKIAKVLNEQKVPALKSGEWKSTSISCILKNPIYKGYVARRDGGPNGSRTYSEQPNPEYIIIPEDIWDKVQDMRECRVKRIRKTYPISTSGRLLFMDILYCGYCGKKFTNGSRYDYWTTKDGEKRQKIVGRYRCGTKAAGSLRCEGRGTCRQEEIEPILLNVIGNYMDSLGKTEVYSELLEMQEKQRKTLKANISQQEKKIKSIKEDIATLEDKIPDAIRGEYVIPIDKLSNLLEDREKSLQGEIETLREMEKEYKQSELDFQDLEKYNDLIVNWRETFEQAPAPMKKVIIGKLIGRIDVYNDDIKIKFRVNSEDFVQRITGGCMVSEQGIRLHHHLIHRI